ncbi:hypothetical protein AGOR_G00244420 [Albula goreensis]|uniref:Major facilitator superfamily (MFS) profile domain-containing protein n=1 Tax=Albula goreensis TaxID=1534307 RepID=A0A8T3CGN3_9TELE|nr:hypothetical protein AGOR_G00244420 [Albula goreensis]
MGLFLIGMVFPFIVEYLGPYSFLIFLVFCLSCGLFVWFNVPETKNKTVLEITEEFRKMHTRAHKHQAAKQEQNNLQMVKSTKL